MALLEVSRQHAESGALPPVCLRCGKPAITVKYRTFTRYPWQTSALALLRIRYEPALHRIRAGIPLCADHRHYWLWTDALWWLPVVFFLPVCCAELVILAVAFSSDFGLSFAIAMGVNVVLCLAWLVWLPRLVIRAVRVDAMGIVFQNVPDEVVRQWKSRERCRDGADQPS
jgi:hypothetical protein